MQHQPSVEPAQILEWRRRERLRLIEARLAMSVAARQQASVAIAARLDAHWRGAGRLLPGTVVSAYWPLRGEPDLRAWLALLHQQGVVCVLPVVVARGAPLVFRRWSPGCTMEKGIWNIPVPADPQTYIPQRLIAPVVGFDAGCYRLGYGGGYFDRTLAQLGAQQVKFQVLGVGYANAKLDSIQPLPHDIPLHGIVTEERTWSP